MNYLKETLSRQHHHNYDHLHLPDHDKHRHNHHHYDHHDHYPAHPLSENGHHVVRQVNSFQSVRLPPGGDNDDDGE